MIGVRGVPGGDPPEPLDVKDGGDGRDSSAGEEIGGDGSPTMEFTIWFVDPPVPVLVGQCPTIMPELDEVLLLLLLFETTTAATAAAFPNSPAPFKFNWLSSAALNSSEKLNPAKSKKPWAGCCCTYCWA